MVQRHLPLLVAIAGATHDSPQAHALLAVASSSGWLCVFEASQPGAQGWALCHSTGSLISPGAPTHLAFSADGSSLAVASPVAQLVGTDAVAVVAAGGQPGAVSLYQVASGRADSSSGALAGLLPPLLLEQQQRVQLPELLLWHSWSLCSMPAGLLVLPSSGFKLLSGKQLQPTQVIHGVGRSMDAHSSAFSRLTTMLNVCRIILHRPTIILRRISRENRCVHQLSQP